MSKRTTISNGIRWVRYPLIPVILELVISSIENAETRSRDLLILLVFLLLYYLLFKMRRVRFDEGHIYRIYGKKEKAVPFSEVQRIEKSGAKLNSRRMWRLRYLDADKEEKNFLFIDGIFQHGSVKELIEKVRAVNPGVEVEESHIWNQVEQQKRRKKKRKERREKKTKN
ncbi:MAG: hypothetical protein HEP71_03645 [Roseivirga sp.]|nr:hypothetical protein [Roseivirga sp.]